MELVPSVKNVLILDSEGRRIAVKYWSDDWPTNDAKEAFEKAVFTKTKREMNAHSEVDITVFQNNIVVYKFLQDLHFFVTGGKDENELILSSFLRGFFYAVDLLLSGNMDRTETFENLDLILLCLDDIVDGGIILETEATAIVRNVGGNSADMGHPLYKQMHDVKFSYAFGSAWRHIPEMYF